MLFLLVWQGAEPAWAQASRAPEVSPSGSFKLVRCDLDRCDLGAHAPQGSFDFIFVNDWHPDVRIKVAMVQPDFVEALHRIGVRAYAIETAATEAMSSYLQRAKSGERVDWSSPPELFGPAFDQEATGAFTRVARELSQAGLRLFAADHPNHNNQYQTNLDRARAPDIPAREREIERLLVEGRRAHGPVIALMGACHASWVFMTPPGAERVLSVARSLALAGYRVVSLRFQRTDLPESPEPPFQGSSACYPD